MNLNAVRMVLVETSHPGNIGSAARAMKTMGLRRLVLVAPQYFPHAVATELAAGADDILEEVLVVDTLAAALADCQLVIAASARPRDIDLPGLIPRTAAELVDFKSDYTEVAFVFGRERSGLTNAELLMSHYHLMIPSNPDYCSLNLAQAVQIIAYELYLCVSSELSLPLRQKIEPLAKSADIELFYEHLKELLIAIDFLKLSNPKKLLQRLRRLFNRVKLEQSEVNILRGILTHLFQALSKNIKNP